MSDNLCVECKSELPADASECPACDHKVSDPDASLDTMVQQASVPNLATLFRKAKKAGAIGSVSAY